MGAVPQLGELCPLGNPEPVLLVGNHQSQVGEAAASCHQGVGTHHNLSLPGGHGILHQPPLSLRQRPGEQFHPDAQGGKELSKRGGVLLRQNFRGGHHSGLEAVFYCKISSSCRHHGFAAAHVSLNQPVHHPALCKVPHNLPDGPVLGIGEGKGQRLIKGGQIQICEHRPGLFLPGVPQKGKAGGKEEKLLKNHPLPGLRRLLHGSGAVNHPVSLCRR